MGSHWETPLGFFQEGFKKLSKGSDTRTRPTTATRGRRIEDLFFLAWALRSVFFGSPWKRLEITSDIFRNIDSESLQKRVQKAKKLALEEVWEVLVPTLGSASGSLLAFR